MGDFEGRAEPGPGGPADFWSRKLVEIKVPDRTALFLDNGIPGEERFCEFQSAYTGQPKVFANQFPARHKLGGIFLVGTLSIPIPRASTAAVRSILAKSFGVMLRSWCLNVSGRLLKQVTSRNFAKQLEPLKVES